MTNPDQPILDRFCEDITAIIERYRSARCLSYAELIGALHMIAYDITAEARDDEDNA